MPKARSMSDRESGFTLIEMMVALAIFSLAALALIDRISKRVHEGLVRNSIFTANQVLRGFTGTFQTNFSKGFSERATTNSIHR
jgi:prepilin-type N-terminal cleavage/methylation domain-containing protein